MTSDMDPSRLWFYPQRTRAPFASVCAEVEATTDKFGNVGTHAPIENADILRWHSERSCGRGEAQSREATAQMRG